MLQLRACSRKAPGRRSKIIVSPRRGPNAAGPAVVTDMAHLVGEDRLVIDVSDDGRVADVGHGAVVVE